MMLREREKAADVAAFIFCGTVVSLDAPAVPAAREPLENVVLVRVEQVYLAPPPLASYGGQIVAVGLRDGEPLQDGARRIFFTDVWVFGERLVLCSRAHEDPAAANDVLGTLTSDPLRNFEDREIRAHLAAADCVVLGLVVSTHLVELDGDDPAPRVRGACDPRWCNARIRVLGTERGTLTQPEITVRYPSSTDVRWFHVPKLQAGTTYVLALHAREAAGAFAIRHAADVHPLQRLGRIRAMIADTRARA